MRRKSSARPVPTRRPGHVIRTHTKRLLELRCQIAEAYKALPDLDDADDGASPEWQAIRKLQGRLEAVSERAMRAAWRYKDRLSGIRLYALAEIGVPVHFRPAAGFMVSSLVLARWADHPHMPASIRKDLERVA